MLGARREVVTPRDGCQGLGQPCVPRRLRPLLDPAALRYWAAVIALAALLAGIVGRTVASAERSRDAWGSRRTVLVAARTLEAGDALGPAEVRSVRWPAELVPPEAVSTLPDEVRARGPIGAGAPITADVVAAPDELEGRYVVALVTNGNTDADRGGLPGRFAFRLPADEIGLRKPDPRIFEVAAAAAGCRTSELAYVGDDLDKDVAAPQAAGARGIWVDRSGGPLPARVASGEVIPDAIVASLAELPAVLARFDEEEAQAAGSVGVGPHPRPWPADDRLDPALLAVGDRRNVVDRYRYWREQAIVADLDQRRHPVHVAIENWRHDLNIGTVVRNANAFNVAGVHIVGQRRWNRRGAMATDRYLHVHHHATVAELVTWAASAGLCLVGIDNVAGAVDLDAAPLPERCTLVLGQEGPGLSEEVLDRCQEVRSIGQHGSTRSLNAGVASGIALHAWARDHASGTATWPEPPVVS